MKTTKTNLTIQLENGQSVALTVSAKLKKSGVVFPNDSSDMLHNQFTVTITRDKQRISLAYYDSNKNFNDCVEQLDESSLKSALECFISDAMAANNSFEDFCSEFGYDTDSRRAYKIYNECKKSKAKFDRVFSDVDIYDLYNALNETVC